MKGPLVSVIVTTRNEEKHIANCLKSIKEQSYPNIEIIVVDNNSTDKTKEIAKRFTKKVYNKGPERSVQRNFGVSKANGKYLLYLDADMILSPMVVEECVETLEKDKSLVGLYIPEKIIGHGLWIKVRNFERSFYDGTVIDAVRFIPKETFMRAGGFDEKLTGPEDWDLDKRVRALGSVKIIKAPLYHNETFFNLRKYLKKKKYYLNTINSYIEKWGSNDPDVKKQVHFFYRMIGVFIERGKYKKLIRNPLLSLLMFYLKLRIGIQYLSKGK